MPTVKIPSSLLETIQSTFKLEAKRICHDLATILQKPEKELLEKVLQSPITLQVFDTSTIELSCPVLLQTATILERCRRPCILGTGLCVQHQHITAIPDLHPSLQHLTRIESAETHPTPLWCDETTGIVYSDTATCVGWYKDTVLTLVTYTTEEDDVTE